MTVIEIVCEYLKREGFDGLYNVDGECGCLIAHMEPCEEMRSDCKPGYKHPCIGGDCDGDYEWSIEKEKP